MSNIGLASLKSVLFGWIGCLLRGNHLFGEVQPGEQVYEPEAFAVLTTTPFKECRCCGKIEYERFR